MFKEMKNTLKKESQASKNISNMSSRNKFSHFIRHFTVLHMRTTQKRLESLQFILVIITLK